MPDQPANTDDRDAPPPVGPNSDPTGIGPPPSGAKTEVTPDGHGVTRSSLPGESDSKPGSSGAKPAG